MTELQKANREVTELERDAQRINDLALAASEAARAARGGDPTTLSDAAAKAAGLHRVHQELLTDLATARSHRDEVRAQADHADAQAAHKRAAAAHHKATADAKEATLEAADALRAAIHKIREANKKTEATAQAATAAARKLGEKHAYYGSYDARTGYSDLEAARRWDGAGRLTLALRDLIEDTNLR